MSYFDAIARQLKTKIGTYDIKYKCDTIDNRDILQKLSIATSSCSFDLKNKTITVNIVEFNEPDFLSVLKNLFQSKNIQILLAERVLSYDKNEGRLNNTSKNLMFSQGEVLEHGQDFVTKDKYMFMHMLKFKFKTTDVLPTVVNF